jgi:hypothetical protein
MTMMRACMQKRDFSGSAGGEQTNSRSFEIPSRNPEISLTPDGGRRIQGWKRDQGDGLIIEDLLWLSCIAALQGVFCLYLDFNI